MQKYKKKKRLGSYPHFTVVFSITMALFVIGVSGLLIIHASALSYSIRNNIEIQVYLDKYISEEEIAKLTQILKSRTYLEFKDSQPQISFVSKDEAAKKFIQATGEEFITFLGENPLRDALSIKIKPDFYQTQKMRLIKEDLEKIPGVFEATFVENLVEDINKNLIRVTFILLAFATILLFTISILINNTIKLALFSQRFLIRSMQLVGATSSFIQKPFLIRAALQGLCSGLLASALLLALLHYANTQIEELIVLQDNKNIAILLALLIILGTAIGLLSSYRSINRYMQLSLNELY